MLEINMKKIVLFVSIIFLQNSIIAQINHSTWDAVLQAYVSDDGLVNYKSIKANPENLDTYLKEISNNTPQDNWSSEDELAYWINAYNAFTVKLIIDNYPVSSIKDIKNAWDLEFIELQDSIYSLNHIEHQIIRKMDEPRIHFALVCAAVSCPKLYNQAFEAESLDEDLTKLTKDFLRDPTKNNISEKRLELSKIFTWFEKDFKQNGKSLIDFLNSYVTVQISPKAKKVFNKYDWRLNE